MLLQGVEANAPQTGWVNAVDWLELDPVPPNTTFYVMRIGPLVLCRAQLPRMAAKSITPPVGWRPTSYWVMLPFPLLRGNSIVGTLAPHSSNQLRIEATFDGAENRGAAWWITTDPMPA